MPKYEPILLKNMLQPGYTGSLTEYERVGGYQAIRKVLGANIGQIIPLVTGAR